MSSSEDELDDNNMFDQLRSIKAFTLDQLYLIHPDVSCPSSNQSPDPKSAHDTSVNATRDANHDLDLYQNLVDYEQLRNKLLQLKSQIKQISRKTFDRLEDVWVFQEEAPRKIGMCLQGKIAETTFRYKTASIDKKQISSLDVSFSELLDMIVKDYIYYSFESQMKRHRIATHLSIVYQEPDDEKRSLGLRSSIATLIDFIKHLNGDGKSEFVQQCRNWIRCLISKFLEQETTEYYRFIVGQLSKGPAGTADWSSDLIECKPFEKVVDFESTPSYISHCCALLHELFRNLKSKVRRVTISTVVESSDMTSKPEESGDQRWSLIDPRFSCSEELNLSKCTGNVLSENDVIKFCLKIPVAQIFRAYVKRCLETDDFTNETDKSYEFIMLKLLTIGTVIIKTYQTGLETFNSIQYGNLIEYISSQIRRTVIVLSDQWAEFKHRLKGLDNALLMRLQVEYDNFILRSILIILELRQSGIWRHLSRIEQDLTESVEISNSWSAETLGPALTKFLQVTGLSPTAQSSSQITEIKSARETQKSQMERKSSSKSLTYEFSVEWFKEVSEPMLWHILWQFYHNAFVNLCDYHSDNYWLEKFKEKSVVYLFVNKIRDSLPSECSYLISSITSMLLSRRNDSKLVVFIASEIFDLAFKYPDLKEKTTKIGTRCLIRSAAKFPSLISLYMSFIDNEDPDPDVVKLFKGCTMYGWLCNEDEVQVISRWLIEYPIGSSHNKIARLLISKVLLNSPKLEPSIDTPPPQQSSPSRRISQTTIRQASGAGPFVDLKLRRRLALLLYEASVKHNPGNNEQGPKSLGTSVEVEFGTLFCEKSTTSGINLIELSLETSYQQFYVWIWRLLFTFRLHILNQQETDWNDVQCRSGTSRSIKNTVLADDAFHPVPSIQDPELILVADGVGGRNPVASFIYLVMTEVTWQSDNLDQCLEHLNMMADSGHLTPSLLCLEFLLICHLDSLTDVVAKKPKCLEYFKTIFSSSFDASRFASLIVTQMQNLKQYRQIQLSHFYIMVLLEVATTIIKRQSTSWFSGDEFSLEKIVCVLDYIVKFNFTTQRPEIIRKFYDCSYTCQRLINSSSWLGSLLSSSSSSSGSSGPSKRELTSTLHLLTQKYKKYTWLRWVTTECDTLRQEKIWEDLVVYLSTNETSTLDMAIKKVCPQISPSVLKSSLPIYSWINQIFDIVESDLNHPLCPLIWYNFFLNYFANSLNGVSVGRRLVRSDVLVKLTSRLDALFNYHLYKHRNWVSGGNLQQNSLAQLYRAYRFWLQDSSLQDAYVDIDRLRDDYLVDLLKSVMESSTEDACYQYIDIQSIELQNRNLCQIWSTATRLEGNHLAKDLIFVESNQNESMEILTSIEDEASDVASLINKNSLPNSNSKREPSSDNKRLAFDLESELRQPVERSSNIPIDRMMDVVKEKLHGIIDESMVFSSNVAEFDRTKDEILELIQQLYVNKKRQVVRMVNCSDGTDCAGPATIKFEVQEATIDDRISECVQDRQRQSEELIAELLTLPSNRVIVSTILIEEMLAKLVGDQQFAKESITSLLRHISDSSLYEQLNGVYYASNQLLKSILETLSSSSELDTYNEALLDVCFSHPGSVQVLSPNFSPSLCSKGCFLELYRKMCSQHQKLGSMATFVLLSKFDVNNWIRMAESRELHQEIIRTTCSALRLMGKQADDSFTLTYDLFRRHLDLELAAPGRRKPEEIKLVLREFLMIMDQQELRPSLWVDFMRVLGLEKRLSRSRSSSDEGKSLKSRTTRPAADSSGSTGLLSDELADESSINEVIEDVSRVAECQMILDHNSLTELMDILVEFVNQKHEKTNVTLLESFMDYVDDFGLLLLTVTFMWLKAFGELYPDNHQMIWSKFSGLWAHWVYPRRNCTNVTKNNYRLMANLYVTGLRFMIHKIPGNTQLILRSVIGTLTEYVLNTREIVYLELSILQKQLKNLPWSQFVARAEEFDYLAILCEQENYNISDLISCIMLQFNLKESLAEVEKISMDQRDGGELVVARVAERLATVIVIQSPNLKGFRLDNGCHFHLVPIDRVPHLVSLVLPRMEFANLEHNLNNKLLVNLLRNICITNCLADNSLMMDENQRALNSADLFERNVLYARFISSYLIDLVRNHPNVMDNHYQYVQSVMSNTLLDLRPLQSADVDPTRKIELYESLLDCCSSLAVDESWRLPLARLFVDSSLIQSKPIMCIEALNAAGQIISDSRVLVQTVERLIVTYLNSGGHYEKVWKSFKLKVLPSDLYLEACVDEYTPIALLVYFESMAHNASPADDTTSQQTGESLSSNEQQPTSSMPMNGNRIWSSFFHWLTKMTSSVPKRSSEAEHVTHQPLVVAWVRMLYIVEPNLSQFLQYSRSTRQRPSSDPPQAAETVSPDSQAPSETGASHQEPDPLATGSSKQPPAMSSSQKSLVELIKQLIALYDSKNGSSLWSYIVSSRDNSMAKVSVMSLAVGCFLADRSLVSLNFIAALDASDSRSSSRRGQEQDASSVSGQQQQAPAGKLASFMDEISRLRRLALARLEAARKAKSHEESAQFIEALIESAKRSDKVQYSEGVQLITEFVRAAYASQSSGKSLDCIHNILRP